MFQKLKIYNEFDFFLVPFFLILIFLFAYNIKLRNKAIKSYDYLIKGMVFKLLGVISFILVYVYYYKGGDTNAYFYGAKAVANLLLQDFGKGIDVLFNLDSVYNNFSVFNSGTGYPPPYMWRDAKTFSVCRFTTIFSLLSLNSFIVTSFLVCIFSYLGVWKFYRLVNILFSNNEKALAYIILYLPSLIFWGGGIMKDSYVLGSVCWISYNFYFIFIKRKKLFWNFIWLFLNFLIILNTKSYVLLSLFPGVLLWLNNAYIKQIKNKLIKVMAFPVIIFIISALGFVVFNSISSSLGSYGSVGTIIEKAQITQDDLLRVNAYGKNNYNLGKLDGTITGFVSLAPVAIFTALFRPFIWEVANPAMAISSIENSILLIFIMLTLIKLRFYNFFKIIFSDPFLLYCFFFSVVFAFGVGLAGTNFGALVRYKIPLMPFFFTMVYIVSKKSLKKF